MNKILAIASVLGLKLSCLAAFSNSDIGHVSPMNILPSGQEVFLPLESGKALSPDAAVTDYYGKRIPFRQDIATGRLVFGNLAPGYYEISDKGRQTSFGVATRIARTADEARRAGSRFGVKTFLVGRSGVWWRRPLTWEVDECTTACERMGLQWTRHAFNLKPDSEAPGVISTGDLVTNHQMNCVMKVEGIPAEAYDVGRYGPMEEFARKRNRRGWERCSVPLKDPYQRWLAEEIAKLPPDQNVFEIGNEVWDYMSAAEFAEWCRMAVPVIRKLRPGASIGADPGKLRWGVEFAKAGGFEGMDALYIHPYSFTPPPELRVRAWIRNRRDFFSRLTGRKLDVYVTEYGWPTAPKDGSGRAVDERRQAQRTTRESLLLYAEGCKTLIPHWMADREQDPANIEHWFGMFRLCGEPKPVIMAHAACARMIDTSTFVGDLVLPGAETGVGSMLFRKSGEWVVALWTLDEAPGSGREIAVPVKNVRAYGIMGDEIRPKATAKGVVVKASSDVVYLVGKGAVPKALEALVDRSGELSETRWFNRVDGVEPKFTVAAGHPVVREIPCEQRSYPARCAAAAWHDDKSFRMRLDVPAAALKDGTGVWVVNVTTRPDRQLSMDDYDYYDYELRMTVKGESTEVTLTNCALGGVLRPAASGNADGVVWSRESKDGVMTLEIALPKAFLAGWGENRRGLMAGQCCWVSGGKKWNAASRLADRRYSWPLWKLEK